jgi:hypothetical protein
VRVVSDMIIRHGDSCRFALSRSWTMPHTDDPSVASAMSCASSSRPHRRSQIDAIDAATAGRRR